MSDAPSAAIVLVSRARVALGAIAVIRAALWSAAVLVAIFAADELLSLVPAIPSIEPARGWSLTVAAAGALMCLGILLWRERFVWSRPRVALWIEERLPRLKYALVTLIDQQYAEAPSPEPLDAAVRHIHVRSFLCAAARRALFTPSFALALAVLCFATLPVARHDNPAARVAVTQRPPIPNRLLSLTATLTPPAYTGWHTETFTDPTTVHALAGTRVTLTGHGRGDGVEGRVGEQAIAVTNVAALDGIAFGASDNNAGWAISVTLSNTSAALILTDRNYRRIVVLDPHPDLAPVVTLRLPATDATVHAVTGSLTLEAEIQDDVGLAEAHFEYIVSSGEGEGNFTSRTGMLAEQSFERNTLTGRLQAAVPYAWFKLKPGDQVSVRAVAVDGNTLTGPGRGYSESRLIRVTREKERANIDVNPAPPPFDASVMSLRMLIVATEKLDRRRPSMQRAPFMKEAAPLASQAEGIRQKIQGFIDDRGQGGSFQIDPLLTEALAAMWDASRSLGIAETGEALPPLRKAHAALKKLSNASKYYFRGQPPPVMVDVTRVRMSGTETVTSSARGARSEDRGTAERLAARFAAAVQLLKTDPAQAVEQMTLLRVDALRELPPLAVALEKVIGAVDSGRDSAEPLVEARHVIEGRPRVYPTLPSWSPLP
jgi:hypothetical protein